MHCDVAAALHECRVTGPLTYAKPIQIYCTTKPSKKMGCILEIGSTICK